MIYTGHMEDSTFVELVAAIDGEYMFKGGVLECCTREGVSGDPFLPTRQRNREAMVYEVKFAVATEEDRQHWRSNGILEPHVSTITWAIVHRRCIGSMPWWEAYGLTLASTGDTHMSARQRRRPQPALLEPPRASKLQRTLF